MINEERVYLMTQLSQYEKEQEKLISISRYSRRDYIGIALIGNFFLITIAYALLLALVVAANLAYVIKNLYDFNYMAVGALILIGYILLLSIYSGIVYIYRSMKYKKAQNSVHRYTEGLQALVNLYKKEEMIKNSEEEM